MKKNLKVKDALPGLGARLFMRLGAFAARMLFNRKLNIHLENWDLLENMKPPFILVANHVSNYDPAIIAANQKHFIHWVANDAVFRSSFMRLIFRWIQVIPKTKGMSDLDTVRNMHRKIRQGGVVGLFPEGQTSWDGLTQPLMPATPKLLKLFKVPVVAVVNKGGYMSHPRWSWQLRRGRMILEARLVLDGEGIKTAGVGEITARLEKALAHDDFEFCRRNPFPLKSEKRAEKLELFIYVCPSCRKLESLVSRGNDMVCSCCGWTVHVDEYGQFSRDEALPFSHNLEAWGRWQRVVAEEIILSGLEAPEREGQVLLLIVLNWETAGRRGLLSFWLLWML